MPRIKFPYKEGDWFMLPLEDKGFAIGIIARENKGGRILSYFFAPRIYKKPSKKYLNLLMTDSAIAIEMHGCQGFIMDKTWKIIGNKENFQRKDWPIPQYVRADLGGEFYFVTYNEDTFEDIDLKKVTLESIVKGSISSEEIEKIKKEILFAETDFFEKMCRYPIERLSGSEAMEFNLTEIFKELESKK